MKGADMVTAAVTAGGVVRIEDRHALFAPTTYSPSTGYKNGYSDLTAAEDTHADWAIVAGGEDNGKMFVHLTRALATGDQQDRDVVSGSNRIIWAWGATDTVGYHASARGSSTHTFFGSSADTSLPAYDGKWSYAMSSYTVPKQVTTYACQSFSLPTDAARHIVAIRPTGVSKYNHHAILHVCTNNAYFTQHATPQLCSYSDSNTNPSGGQGTSPLGNAAAGCSGLIWSWAVGMGDFVLPSAAGLRVGSGSGATTHVVLEIHYDNPSLDENVKDIMGFDAYYVNTLRANDAAMMILGDPIVNLGKDFSLPPYTTGDIPAGQTEVHRQATCPGACTSSFSSTITVFAHFLHMHYYGKKMYTEKFSTSGASEGVVGGRIDFWDNGYQQNIPTSYTVAPGETLQTHCYWNTAQMSGSEITFGTPTSSEMCQDFVFYYPVQYRGVDINDNAEPFAMCGLAEAGGNAYTVCGSLSQKNQGYLLTSGQEDKGVAQKADPLNFGLANLAALASPTATACAYVTTPQAPPPSPSPLPPSPSAPPPPLMPGAEVVTVYKTKIELVAKGSVEDITAEKRSIIQTAFAEAAGVRTSAVDVTVAAASVKISVVITSASQDAADFVNASISTHMASSATATEFLATAEIEITATPTITNTVEQVVVTRSKQYVSHVTHAVFMSLAFGLLFPGATAFPLFLRQSLPEKWLNLHKWCNVIALVLGVAAVVVSIIAVAASGAPHFGSLHGALGLAVIILAVVQVALGLLRPPKPTRRSWWILIHRLCALLVVTLPIVQCVTGIQASNRVGSRLNFMYGVFFGCVGLAATFLAGAFAVKTRGGITSTKGGAPTVGTDHEETGREEGFEGLKMSSM